MAVTCTFSSPLSTTSITIFKSASTCHMNTARSLARTPQRHPEHRQSGMSASERTGCPSGWRNWLLQAIAAQVGGNSAIASWQRLWTAGHLQDDTIQLFTSASVTPVDGGWKGHRGPSGLQEQRGMRPIACSEVLVKLGEGIDIQRSSGDLKPI